MRETRLDRMSANNLVMMGAQYKNKNIHHGKKFTERNEWLLNI